MGGEERRCPNGAGPSTHTLQGLLSLPIGQWPEQELGQAALEDSRRAWTEGYAKYKDERAQHVVQPAVAPTAPTTGGSAGPAAAQATKEPAVSTPVAAPPATATQGTSKATPSPNGREDTDPPPARNWAKSLFSKEEEQNQKKVETPKDDCKPRQDNIIDFLLFLAKQRQARKNGEEEEKLPEELKRYESTLPSGVPNISKARYLRRGMRNDANNCYVNVVIQSLLPCSALMQLLSHCANDSDRPFYTGMQKLCKEFHNPGGKVHGGEPCNVLALPQVKELISMWQKIGAQQDAGEFLFYMLNGMHEECKWTADTSTEATAESGSEDDNAWAQVAKGKRKVEVRSAGCHEDSPIVRIFGGLLRSSVRSKSAKADSVSVEPFNHLILDISSPTVDSVYTALEAYCGAETVNEGAATRRLQFQMLPKVLVVNLKRFSYNKDSAMPQKIKKAVKYEEKLVFEKSWLVDDLDPPEYTLMAVICHIGESANGGHYNAAVRYNTEWYIYDDVIVRQMELREVMNQQFTAYLLLYSCTDKVEIRP